MKKIITSTFALILSLATALSVNIHTFSLKEEINSKAWIYTQKAVSNAINDSADMVILHINTYGGEVVYADSIRTAILNCPIKTVAFIDNNAASAGALISIACDKIYMRPGGSIGAATVVNGADGSAMPDKYQSYMRATMRATAESHGKDSLGIWLRDPRIAEAMVDESIEIDNISKSGKILTFTTEEAIKNRYCEGTAENIDDVITAEGYDVNNCTITEFNPSTMDNMMGWLTNSALRGILIMLIIGGIYFELQSPGIGFPLAIAVTATLLYFAPLYIEGVAAYWEIGLFLVGIILLILELFVIPGFGIAGISGILAIITSLIFSMLDNDFFNFERVDIPDVNESLLTVMIGLILGFVAVIWISHKIGSKGVWRKLSLKTEQTGSDGYVGVPVIEISPETTGTVSTDLRPSGKVDIDGRLYDAVAIFGEYIPKGTTVKVIKTEAGRVYVTDYQYSDKR